MAPTHADTAPAREHPVVARLREPRGAHLQLRIADALTRFAGSMAFVYLHVGVFTGWMLLVERRPWPTLTQVVSLEAIFLSTFLMIGQNRSAAFQQAKADHDFLEQDTELKTNTELTREVVPGPRVPTGLNRGGPRNRRGGASQPRSRLPAAAARPAWRTVSGSVRSPAPGWSPAPPRGPTRPARRTRGCSGRAPVLAQDAADRIGDALWH